MDKERKYKKERKKHNRKNQEKRPRGRSRGGEVEEGLDKIREGVGSAHGGRGGVGVEGAESEGNA